MNPGAGAEEPEHPAPGLRLAAATGDAAVASAPAVAAPADQGQDEEGTNWLDLLGVAIGAAGLVAGLLAYRRAAS